MVEFEINGVMRRSSMQGDFWDKKYFSMSVPMIKYVQAISPELEMYVEGIGEKTKMQTRVDITLSLLYEYVAKVLERNYGVIIHSDVKKYIKRDNIDPLESNAIFYAVESIFQTIETGIPSVFKHDHVVWLEIKGISLCVDVYGDVRVYEALEA